MLRGQGSQAGGQRNCFGVNGFVWQDGCISRSKIDGKHVPHVMK